MNKTVFDIPKMDCPSEESLVRMALEKTKDVKHLEFDLSSHQLTVVHTGTANSLLAFLLPLGFGARIARTDETSELSETISLTKNSTADANETHVLRQLLAINGFMFVVELVTGLAAQSTGLIADSLDMLADAAVYIVSLYAVGKAASLKRRAARFSGFLQLVLAIAALSEVVRRTIFGSDPEPPYMIGVALLALIANVSCLLLLARHRKGEVHMKASWIFSTNDVIANIGVIVAGGLVLLTKTNIPDLIIGSIIAIVVFRGSLKILKLTSTQ